MPRRLLFSIAGARAQHRPHGLGRALTFLTTDANDLVKAYHPKAMPVILTTAEEIERWLTAPVAEALQLQRPLPDGALQLVARGVATDRRPAA